MFLQLPWSFFCRHLSSKHLVAGGMAPEEQQVSSESYVELETQKSMRYDWCSIRKALLRKAAEDWYMQRLL